MRALAGPVLVAGAGALALALALRAREANAFLAALCGTDGGSAWTFDGWVTVPLGLSAALYLVGTARIWRGAGIGHGITLGQAGAYLGGWLTLAGALLSPLHRWGEGLFTAHMIEHEAVMALAAPLLVLARPGVAFLWALPRPWRGRVGRALNAPGTRAVWAFLSRPAVAAALHGVAIWVWHAPSVFDAAVANVVLHRLQHLFFLGTALLFWWSLLRRSPAVAAGSLVLTMLHTGLLGALLALAPRVLYPAQTAGAPAWGLTPLEDQQLAGLLMWVPAGAVYAGAALWLAARSIRRSGTGWRREAHAVAEA